MTPLLTSPNRVQGIFLLSSHSIIDLDRLQGQPVQWKASARPIRPSQICAPGNRVNFAPIVRTVLFTVIGRCQWLIPYQCPPLDADTDEWYAAIFNAQPTFCMNFMSRKVDYLHLLMMERITDEASVLSSASIVESIQPDIISFFVSSCYLSLQTVVPSLLA